MLQNEPTPIRAIAAFSSTDGDWFSVLLQAFEHDNSMVDSTAVFQTVDHGFSSWYAKQDESDVGITRLDAITLVCDHGIGKNMSQFFCI